MTDRKLTPEFLKKNNIVFRPCTRQEASVIQNRLFKMDFAWGDGSRAPQLLDECLKGGILILDGKIYHGPDPAHRHYIACDMGQLDENGQSFEEKVMALFNEQAERQKRIEEKLDLLLAEIGPKTIDKPKSIKTSSRL